MRHAIITTLILSSLLSVVTATAIERHAILIGLGCYHDKAWTKINGDRDIPIISELLRRHNFTDISTLIDRQATKKGIISSFAGLVDRCRTDDIVYIHFSGHGQRMTDVNGDEDDGWDETWVPYDAKRHYSDEYHGENHITDDEVGHWMTKLREKIGTNGRILIVVDACHSGDSSRGNFDERVTRGVMDNFIIPLERRPAPIEKIKEDWLTISACKNYQLNCEIKTEHGNFGILSYALSQMGNDINALNNLKFMSQLARYIDENRGPLPQTPTLSGETTIYSIRDIF